MTNTQFNHLTECKQLIYSIYNETKCFYRNHNEHLEAMKRLYESNSYKRLTIRNKEYIAGMNEVLLHNIQQNEVIWMHYYEAGGDTFYVDKWDKLPEYIRETENFKSTHVWKGTTKHW